MKSGKLLSLLYLPILRLLRVEEELYVFQVAGLAVLFELRLQLLLFFVGLPIELRLRDRINRLLLRRERPQQAVQAFKGGVQRLKLCFVGRRLGNSLCFLARLRQLGLILSLTLLPQHVFALVLDQIAVAVQGKRLPRKHQDRMVTVLGELVKAQLDELS